MRWRGNRTSSNVEDRRRQGGTRRTAGGSLIGALLPMLLRRKGAGLWTVVLVGIGAFALSGGDLGKTLQLLSGGGGGSAPSAPYTPSPREEELAQFASVVLADTEDTWSEIYQTRGQRYRAPKLVMYTGSTSSACGHGDAAMGPFYCPADEKVYLDLSFFDDLDRRFGAPGDFAQAYVIGHEIGHHVQTISGISRRVAQQKHGVSEVQANQLSVRQELQADCYAGIWAHHAHKARQVLEAGDIEEGINAASAIGDDRMQKRAGRSVTPDSFTHGSSADRVRWFKHGLEQGTVEACDTFAAR
ncbi:MAG: neutral zinc metallopeptidase [Myxococcota bacterium]